MSPEWVWFACVALCLVAGLAFALGWVLGARGEPRPTDRGAKDAQTLTASNAPAVPEALLQPTAPASAEKAPPAPSPLAQALQPTRAGVAEEISAFHYTITHDLRAPLRVIEGFAKILKEDYGRQFDRIGNDHIDRIQGAAQRMNGMLESMLSLARISQHELAKEPVNLSQMAQAIAKELQQQAPGRRAEFSIEPELLVVGDPTLLRQLMENLLSNAWKYSAHREVAHIALASRHEGTQLTYIVSDDGAGFDMKAASRLFGLFQRLHSASKFAGHGVGLASVQRIVHRHGGRIWAESEPDRGARFLFTLDDGDPGAPLLP